MRNHNYSRDPYRPPHVYMYSVDLWLTPSLQWECGLMYLAVYRHHLFLKSSFDSTGDSIRFLVAWDRTTSKLHEGDIKLVSWCHHNAVHSGCPENMLPNYEGYPIFFIKGSRCFFVQKRFLYYSALVSSSKQRIRPWFTSAGLLVSP